MRFILLIPVLALVLYAPAAVYAQAPERIDEPLAGTEFVVVDPMPELIGGLERLARQVRYPKKAKKAKVEGIVVVQFVVDETGRVIDPKVLEGIGYGCDEEALRVIRSARFTPGYSDGKPVKVQFTLPIRFRIR